jgi:hypothetical protein
MKTTIRKIGIGALLAMLTACGGGGGAGGANIALATGTFTESFDPAPTSYNAYPFADQDVKLQTLYLASEINGAGKITTLRLQRAAVATTVTCPNTTIKLGHTNATALSATFANNAETGQGSLSTVLNNATLTIPAGTANTWFDIPLATPFEYNGKDNLVVEITHVTGCSATANVETIGATSTRRAFSSVVDATPGVSDLGSAETTANSTPDANQMLMQFVFAGGAEVVNGSSPGSSIYPFSAGAGSHVQLLYPAASINGSGPITGVGMVVGATTTAQTYTATIKLGHSTLTDLTTTFASNYSGTPVTVADHLTFTVPANVAPGSTLWLPVNGIFSYNGTDNLIVDIDVSAASGTTSWLAGASTSPNKVRLFGTSGVSTGSTDGGTVNTAFRFYGGKLQKLSGANASISGAFDGLFSSATLYSASDLGTSGNITSVGCRLAVDNPTATSYDHFKVVIGHSIVSSLSAPSTDFVSENTVLNGTVTIPGGLLAGDWVDIPLSTPFNYDGKSNLIVWMGNDGTAGPGTTTVTACLGSTDATRYPAGIAFTNNGVGSTSYGPVSGTTDIRMTIQK